jgi:hypothetical protein
LKRPTKNVITTPSTGRSLESAIILSKFCVIEIVKIVCSHGGWHIGKRECIADSEVPGLNFDWSGLCLVLETVYGAMMRCTHHVLRPEQLSEKL